jgi:hypothetical protein
MSHLAWVFSLHFDCSISRFWFLSICCFLGAIYFVVAVQALADVINPVLQCTVGLCDQPVLASFFFSIAIPPSNAPFSHFSQHGAVLIFEGERAQNVLYQCIFHGLFCVRNKNKHIARLHTHTNTQMHAYMHKQSKILVETPLAILMPAIFSSIPYFLIGIPSHVCATLTSTFYQCCTNANTKCD